MFFDPENVLLEMVLKSQSYTRWQTSVCHYRLQDNLVVQKNAACPDVKFCVTRKFGKALPFPQSGDSCTNIVTVDALLLTNEEPMNL